MSTSSRRGTRVYGAVALVLTMALLGAACSSDKKSVSTDDTTTQSTAKAPTGTPIKIGWIGTQTTATGAASTQGNDTLDAWVKATNAAGGLSGHPVEAVYADDKADPAVGLAAVRDLVENKKVLAIVGSSAGSTQQTWAPYVLEKKIPVISGSLIDALWFTNPMFYPVGSSVIANIWGQMKSAQVAGNKKVAVILCTEVAACAQAQPLFKSNAEAVGMEQSYAALASQTQASYTAECLAAKKSGATAVAAFINVVVFARDCTRQGYKPFYISADSGPGLSIIKQQPELGNAVGASELWPCLDSSIKGADALYAALKKYHSNWAPGGKDFATFSSPICGAWSGGVALAKAIENAAVTKDAVVTSADIIRGLSMFKDEELGGVAPKVTFGDGTKPSPPQNCTFLYKWKDEKLSAVPAEDGKVYTCKPA